MTRIRKFYVVRKKKNKKKKFKTKKIKKIVYI